MLGIIATDFNDTILMVKLIQTNSENLLIKNPTKYIDSHQIKEFGETKPTLENDLVILCVL